MRFAEFRAMCAEWWSGIFFQSRISRVGEGGNTTDTVQVTAPTADSPEEVIQGSRLEQYGDIVCPTKQCNSISLTKRDGGVVVPLGDPGSRPTDEKSGDRGLYNDAGARVHLYGSQQGAKAGDVVVNNGTQDVARVNDRAKVTIRSVYTVVTMTPPTFNLTVLAVSGTSASVLFQFTAVGTVSIPTAPGTNYDVEVDSTIFEGAPHFKA